MGTVAGPPGQESGHEKGDKQGEAPQHQRATREVKNKLSGGPARSEVKKVYFEVETRL